MWYLAWCLFNNSTSAAQLTDEERGGCGEWATLFSMEQKCLISRNCAGIGTEALQAGTTFFSHTDLL
jgi:hypothetical protein